mmetsp:Transcript_126267/g.404169  ORF Transcript_126267/g.404169 Transcript_126267/m.404169 type:complete len:194 (+) Transcript_126267:61-642(+)
MASHSVGSEWPGGLLLPLAATSVPAGLALFGVFLWTRRVCWAWTIAGALILDVLCLAVKDVIREPRPSPEAAYVLPSEGPYGMPSEHAAFAVFVLVQFVLRMTQRSEYSLRFKVICSGAIAVWASAMIASRLNTGAHSAAQLFAGGASGLMAGGAWFYLEVRLEGPLQKVQGFIDSSCMCFNVLYGDGKVHDD